MAEEHHAKHSKASDKEAETPKKIEKISSEVASLVEEELPEFEDVEEGTFFMDTVKQIFHAAGIRKGGVIGCGIVLLIVLGIGVFFSIGGWDRIKTYLPFGPSPIETPAISLRPSDQTNADLATAYRFGFYTTKSTSYPPSLAVAYMFGGILPTQFFVVPPQQSGLQVSYHYGFRGFLYDRIETYIDNLRQIQSALNTDINGVLNQSINRRVALDQLIRDFDALEEHSRENAGLVTREVLVLQTQTSPLRDRSNLLQRDFNTNLSVFLPRESRRSLEEFITSGKEEVEVRAQLGAFSQMDKYYQVAMVKLAARIKDIKANYEALVKGVKVFDIRNSDLDIIQYEGTPPRDAIPSPIGRSPSSTIYTPIDFAQGIH